MADRAAGKGIKGHGVLIVSLFGMYAACQAMLQSLLRIVHDQSLKQIEAENAKRQALAKQKAFAETGKGMVSPINVPAHLCYGPPEKNSICS